MSIAKELSLSVAQRSYDAMEDPCYYMQVMAGPDALNEFKDGFAEVTGIDRAQLYGAWLAHAGDQPQRWIDAQEEAGYYGGVEQGLLLTIEQAGQRAGWATLALAGIRATRRNDREAVEHVLDTTL